MADALKQLTGTAVFAVPVFENVTFRAKLKTNNLTNWNLLNYKKIIYCYIKKGNIHKKQTQPFP